MSNHLEDNFSLAGKVLRMLTIDWAHVNTPIQTLLHQLDKTWQEAALEEQREAKLEAIWRLCEVAQGLLEEQQDSGSSPINLSYGEAILYAHQGAIEWALGKLESAEAFFEQTVKGFLDSNLGHYNASVIRMALTDILIQKSNDNYSERSSNLEQALKMCQRSMHDLDHAPSSSKQLSLKVEVCQRFEQIVADLCPSSSMDEETEDGSQGGRGPREDGPRPDPFSPRGADSISNSEQGEEIETASSDKSVEQPEEPNRSLTLRLDFMAVYELPMAAGLPKIVDDQQESNPTIDSLIIDGQRYYFRDIELGTGHREKILMLTDEQYSIVKIHGESMSGLDICTGDYILLQRSKDVSFVPEHRQVVAAVIRDEEDRATLKRFLRYKDSFKLVPDPENDEYPSFQFTSMNQVEIVGKAIAVLKKLDG